MMARDKADKTAVMARQKKLLEERYDLTPRPDAKRDDVPRQAHPGRPDREAARGNDLGATGRDVQRRDPRQGAIPQGISALASPQARRGRHGLSRRWRSSCWPAWSGSTSTLTCPNISCPSSRRRST